MGIAGTTALTACSAEPVRTIIPHLIPPDDIVPGTAVWYASTCRECPAGCGILAKNRDGRVIKLEGNPLHPVNRGKLCARGQASLQGLYHPDRFREPLLRNSEGRLEPVSWDRAEQVLVRKLNELAARGKEDRAVFVTGLITGAMRDLVRRFLAAAGSRRHILYEPFAYEPLRTAHQVVFGHNRIPSYAIDESDLIISFGADFLETWLSPVEYARQYAAFRSTSRQGDHRFYYVGPRLSLTAAGADRWICVRPGQEYAIALGMLRLALEDTVLSGLSAPQMERLKAAVQPWTRRAIEKMTGVKEAIITELARAFVQARSPLAIAGCFSGEQPVETAVAADLLSLIKQGSQQTMDFSNAAALSDAAPAAEMQLLAGQCRGGEVDMLLIHDANPLFSLPAAMEFDRSMAAVPFVVSFSSMPDETSERAHLILPVHTPLESWGDYAPRTQVTGLMQPVMGPVFNTRHLGDVLIAVGKKHAGPQVFPWADFLHLLQASWAGRLPRQRRNRDEMKAFWHTSLTTGGQWETGGRADSSLHRAPAEYRFPKPAFGVGEDNLYHFVAYPTIQFFDGRGASRPWLQELPDPLTKLCWDGWVEINAKQARRLGIAAGDVLRISSSHGSLTIPAFPYHGVPAGTLAMPIGQGHSASGRYARGRPANPAQILPPAPDARSGGMVWSLSRVTLEKTGERIALAATAGSARQYDRAIARSISLDQYRDDTQSGRRPRLHLPLPEGYDPERDFYPPHPHPGYRWGMVVDLDRCIGCGACLVACNAENNIIIAGKEEVARGREMFWIRIERYFEDDNPGVRFIPMFCQQCDYAPCEPVCPVSAPHHGADGLNNQVYNRCIGTQFCSQNCPYKVRRFNWLSFPRPEPLNWQYNPDVTVRDKGVMEKCSFCIQRIVEVKNRARHESREVADGEIVPACAQTCPTDALIFGNLKDPQSRVSQLIRDVRAYQVLEHLRTKPAVIYLKKVLRTTMGAPL